MPQDRLLHFCDCPIVRNRTGILRAVQDRLVVTDSWIARPCRPTTSGVIAIESVVDSVPSLLDEIDNT